MHSQYAITELPPLSLAPFLLLNPEVCSSELDDVLEVNDDYHVDVDDIFELECVLELISYCRK